MSIVLNIVAVVSFAIVLVKAIILVVVVVFVYYNNLRSLTI